jgi:hypothetical protein
MATISFFRNVKVRDPKVSERLLREINSGERAYKELEPKRKVDTKEKELIKSWSSNSIMSSVK